MTNYMQEFYLEENYLNAMLNISITCSYWYIKYMKFKSSNSPSNLGIEIHEIKIDKSLSREEIKDIFLMEK